MSWLYRVATNQFYDLKRQEKRHPTTELEEVQLTSLIHIPEIQMLKRKIKGHTKHARNAIHFTSGIINPEI